MGNSSHFLSSCSQAGALLPEIEILIPSEPEDSDGGERNVSRI